MANAYTTSDGLYGGKNQPDPSNSPPSEWLDEHLDADGVEGLVARMSTGQLNDDDDAKRVQGNLGDTRDHIDLNNEMAEVTGGPNQNMPVTNPMKPAVSRDIAGDPVTGELDGARADSTEDEQSTRGGWKTAKDGKK